MVGDNRPERSGHEWEVHLGKPEQPEHTVGHPVEDVHPHLEGARADLVELVEVAVDDGVVREAVLLPGGHHDLLRHLGGGVMGIRWIDAIAHI